MPDIFDRSLTDAIPKDPNGNNTVSVRPSSSQSQSHQVVPPKPTSATTQSTSLTSNQTQIVSVSLAKIQQKYQMPPTPKTTQLHHQAITSAKELKQRTQPIDATADQAKVSEAASFSQSASSSTNSNPSPTSTDPPITAQAEIPKHVDEYSEVMRQEKPTPSRFHAYVPKPVDVHFASQNSKEQIILILRQHPITQLKHALIVISMVLGYFFLAHMGFFGFLPRSYQLGITLFWFLIVIGYSFGTFLKWFYNMYIITDERIIDVDVYSLIKRNMTSAKIDHIQDVTAANYGILGSLFDVGIVVVQTAGAHPMLEFGGVPHPARVVTLINELVLEEEREKIEGRVM